jgi:superfamily II DNA or RNA helicase
MRSEPIRAPSAATGLRQLDSVAAVYSVPRDDLVNEVMIPALGASQSVSCMVAFFESAALGHLAPGLAPFIGATKGQMRLLASPMIPAVDQAAIREAIADPAAVIERAAHLLFTEAKMSSAALARHTYDCLAYLVATGRLAMRIVLMRSGRLFHPKVWVFHDGADFAVVHGSSNFTSPGLLWNYETVSVERPWKGADTLEKATKFARLFEVLWRAEDDDALVVDLPEAVRRALLRDGEHRTPPTIEEFWAAWLEDADRGLAPPVPNAAVLRQAVFFNQAPAQLHIPAGLMYDSGPFAHQGEAVRAWEDAGRRGILAMATGSGKTITALVAAARAQADERRLFLVIAAPYRPLIDQWDEEVKRFGVDPLPLAGMSAEAMQWRLDTAVRSLEVGASVTEVAVVTHDFLSGDPFRTWFKTVSPDVRTMLIADEVHNLGRPSFIADPPERFDLRLGLSATPERQYDPDGTRCLMQFFGAPVFEFPLRKAIGTCLVPYNYHLHTVDLEQDEFEEWLRLTERLRAIGFEGDPDAGDSGPLSPEVTMLLIKRRAVLEKARGKVDALRTLLRRAKPERMRHVLIYTSDKGDEQMQDVNRLLGNELRVLFHQLTAEETANRRGMRMLLQRFAEGEFQALTCKRVLDEGVDLPEVATAYLLASSTVRRQWIQRRGRILRRCDRIGKTIAHLHDFLVVPPDSDPKAARTILRQELDRAREFSVLAGNSGDDDGPFSVMTELLKLTAAH